MFYNEVKRMIQRGVLVSFCVLCSNIAMAQANYEPLRDDASGAQNRRAEEADRVLTPPVVVLVPQIIVSKNYKQITLQDLDIKTKVIGNVATTTYEMTLYNPNSNIMEAELVFPLSENQTIAAVALDINGKMREGVVVEKTKARQTFEAVVRQGADPLLVEKTSGNQFKTRIYPFSPNGTRKIRIVLEEFLNKEKGQFKYTLPLQFKQELKNFSLDIEIPTGTNSLPEVTTDLPNFRFTNVEQVVRSHFEAKNYMLDNTLSFRIPQVGKNKTFTHAEGNQTYFYANLDIKQQDKVKTMPGKIAVVWDTSLSGNKRDIEKEKALLKKYLKKVKDATITFIPFNLEQGKEQTVTVKNGDASALMDLIDNVVYDGATRFNTLALGKIKADEILLFTDGVNTYDRQNEMTLPKIPIYVINSSAEYEPGLLKSWANKTYGSFINLTAVDQNKALALLINKPLRVIRYKVKNIREVYPTVGSEAGENISVSGILVTGEEAKSREHTDNEISEGADLEVVLGYDPKHIVGTEKFTIKAGGNNPAVARLWAMQKIQDLEQDPLGNKKEILALGQAYSIVTSDTSLLVLESAADYARYNITPPEELLAEYNSIIKNRTNEEKRGKQEAWKDAIDQAKEVKEWWNKTFEAPVARKGKYKPLEDNNDGSILSGVLDLILPTPSERSTADEAPAHPATRNASTRISRENIARFASADMASSSMSMEMSADAFTEADVMADVAPVGTSNSAPSSAGSIKVKSWDPDTPYLKILKKSKDAELYADYLKLKTGYEDQPSFYFDITDEFIRRGKNKEALMVLSNVTEMQLDSVELLRIAANKLMQIEQYDYAIELFEKITQLRDEDPQSFRDLALAYWAKGDYQKAFDLFYKVLETNWHRSNEIKQIVFVELNNLLNEHPKLKKKDLPKDLVFKIPVDIRIVMAWSTDNTDMDLHVVDPIGEDCYYGNKLTAIGGRYPHDFTQGFGPEEYMIKKAVDGKYTIRTNNFADRRQSISGATTVYLDIYTNYGSPDQKHERTFVRTENVKEDNTIGEVVWEKKAKNSK